MPLVLVLTARDRRAWRIAFPVGFLAVLLWLFDRVIPSGDPDLVGHLGTIVAGIAGVCLLWPLAATFSTARRRGTTGAVWLAISGPGAATLFGWGSMIALAAVGLILLAAWSLAMRSTRDPARAGKFAGMLALWLAATVTGGIVILALLIARGEVVAAPAEFVTSCLISAAIITTTLFVALVPFVILLVKDSYFRPGFVAQFPVTVAAGSGPGMGASAGPHEENPE